MDSTTIQAQLLVSQEIYVSLPKRPDRVRECATAAASAMDAMAGECGRVISETPRLVDQRPAELCFVELTFQADTAKR